MFKKSCAARKNARETIKVVEMVVNPQKPGRTLNKVRP
jgi:hypothetical protein